MFVIQCIIMVNRVTETHYICVLQFYHAFWHHILSQLFVCIVLLNSKCS